MPFGFRNPKGGKPRVFLFLPYPDHHPFGKVLLLLFNKNSSSLACVAVGCQRRPAAGLEFADTPIGGRSFPFSLLRFVRKTKKVLQRTVPCLSVARACSCLLSHASAGTGYRLALSQRLSVRTGVGYCVAVWQWSGGRATVQGQVLETSGLAMGRAGSATAAGPPEAQVQKAGNAKWAPGT